MSRFEMQVLRVPCGKKYPGKWQSWGITEVLRSAKRNSRTCTSTTREPKKVEVGNKMVKHIVSLIN